MVLCCKTLRENTKVELNLLSMPQTGMQTLKIAQEELPDCYITTRKSPNLHIVQRTISGDEEALLKANRMNLLCCPFVAALQMSCLRDSHNPLNFCCVILCRNKQDIL